MHEQYYYSITITGVTHATHDTTRMTWTDMTPTWQSPDVGVTANLVEG